MVNGGMPHEVDEGGGASLRVTGWRGCAAVTVPKVAQGRPATPVATDTRPPAAAAGTWPRVRRTRGPPEAAAGTWPPAAAAAATLTALG